ncbi:MAG: HAD hydrolase family protein [Candidatus Omnitrophota bacterium]|jgi:3-deoxy-D-manno-octulosonate 8-phosphate phosphatase (KDO 8-P phosphatase)
MSKNISNKTLNLFKKVKLLVLDVDGVLTKGEIIYDDRGRELKIFNVKDGLGIFLLRKAGIKTIFLTAKNSPVLHRRARDMQVEEVMGGISPKESALFKISSKYKVKPENICFMGDDLIDIGLMCHVGIAVAVRDAEDSVKKQAAYVTCKNGGEGAVREVVNLIFKAQKLEDKVYKFIKNPK